MCVVAAVWTSRDAKALWLTAAVLQNSDGSTPKDQEAQVRASHRQGLRRTPLSISLSSPPLTPSVSLSSISLYQTSPCFPFPSSLLSAFPFVIFSSLPLSYLSIFLPPPPSICFIIWHTYVNNAHTHGPIVSAPTSSTGAWGGANEVHRDQVFDHWWGVWWMLWIKHCTQSPLSSCPPSLAAT